MDYDAKRTEVSTLQAIDQIPTRTIAHVILRNPWKPLKAKQHLTDRYLMGPDYVYGLQVSGRHALA